MDRIAYVAKDHQDADEYDVEQNRKKTPEERIDDFIELRRRIYGVDNLDIKEYERSRAS